ncbi:MAG: hypothetical protein LBG48_03915 [Rickettsiales bacterium]|jgi:autotransporter translocation and assembly factor TamB|nr:hypothetical protein [Rickettsiales bacterium]
MTIDLVDFSKSDIKNLMIEEINFDITNGKIYISGRLSERGKKDYIDLLK